MRRSASSIRPWAESQLRQRSRRRGVEGGVRWAGLPQRGGQLGLGLDPVARGEQDRAVERAAEEEEEGASVALGEPVRGADPLDGTLELGALGAGVDHGAAGEDHGVEGATLAPQRPGHGLVEQGESVVDRPPGHQAGTDLGQRAQLEVEIPLPTGDLARLAGQLLPGGRVGLPGAEEQDPAPELGDVELVDQAGRAGEPARGSRGVSEVRVVVDAQDERGGGGLGRVSPTPESAIRAFTDVARFPDVTEPPQRLREPGEAFGCLFAVQGGAKRIPGRGPVPRLERPLTRGQQGLPLVRHGPMVCEVPGGGGNGTA